MDPIPWLTLMTTFVIALSLMYCHGFDRHARVSDTSNVSSYVRVIGQLNELGWDNRVRYGIGADA
jgi:hypothetical protein